MSLPGHGCGIRYNYGLFEQKIINGYQVEYPDRWLQNRNVWEIRKAVNDAKTIQKQVDDNADIMVDLLMDRLKLF